MRRRSLPAVASAENRAQLALCHHILGLFTSLHLNHLPLGAEIPLLIFRAILT